MVDLAAAGALAVAAFVGGALGAMLGGLRAYALAGVGIVVGEVAALAGETGSLGLPFDGGLLGATGLTSAVGLGPVLGPHVAFAGGVAAAAYAARGGDPDPDFPAHEAKNVARVRGADVDVLVVGGVFGVLGLALARGSAVLSLPWDPVAASVVASAFLHRLAFGYPLVSALPPDVLERRPAGPGESRSDGGANATTDDIATDGATTDGAAGDGATDGPATGPGFLDRPRLLAGGAWVEVAALGAAVGAAAAAMTFVTGSPLLPFGLAAAALFLRLADVELVPATHHMALPAGVVVVGLAGYVDPSLVDGTAGVAPAALAATVTLPFALVAGATAGLVGGVLGELAERTLYDPAHTHLDPPSASLVATSLLVALFDVAGLLGQSVIPTPL